VSIRRARDVVGVGAPIDDTSLDRRGFLEEEAADSLLDILALDIEAKDAARLDLRARSLASIPVAVRRRGIVTTGVALWCGVSFASTRASWAGRTGSARTRDEAGLRYR
jgi:hypothetical protein